MRACEQCGKEHDGKFGSGRFCCRSCSNKWVSLNQSSEAKSRKIEAGKMNLKKGWKLTKEQNREYAKLGAQARAVTMSSRRKEWLEGVLSGSIDPWRGSYRTLRNSLIEFRYKEPFCESCKLSDWLGSPVPLELHHKDGNRENNSLTNLQLLCPNCHSMTDNYGWRKSNNNKLSK